MVPKISIEDYVSDISPVQYFVQIGVGFFLPVWVKYYFSGSSIISFFWLFSEPAAEALTQIFTQNKNK